MVYGYIRVSTDRQTVENQRHEILTFCRREKLEIDGWIEETISGTKSVTERKLGTLLEKLKNGDVVICSELSRLGRDMFMIMRVLSLCMDKGCKVITIKDGYRLGDDIQSKVLAFAFGLSAEIERKLISQRTTEALRRLKDDGVTLGRPVGAKNVRYRLDDRSDYIKECISSGMSKSEIARRCGVCRATLDNWLKRTPH